MIFAVIPATYLLVKEIVEINKNILKEDGPIEILGALFFLIASLLFLHLSLSNKRNIFFGKSYRRNIYFAAFALLFFVGFGEEISWGQRIIGWHSPGMFIKSNAQMETNIHNLWIFQAYHRDLSEKSFWERLINMNRLFSIFWFTVIGVIPLMNCFIQGFSRFLKYAGFPIFPLWLAVLFLINLISFRFFWLAFQVDLNELKESVNAACVTLSAIYFVYKNEYYSFNESKSLNVA